MASKERDLLDVTSLQLTAPPCPGAKRPAKLAIKTWNNKVSISVFTNLESLPRYGIVGVNLYPTQFYHLLASMTRVLNEGPKSEPYGESMVIFDKGTKDKKETGRISYGFDANGIFQICVSVPDNQYPKVIFQQRPTYGSEVSVDDKQASIDAAHGWITFWQNIMTTYLLNNFVDESKNNNGGGYNRGGNSGGYGNNQSSGPAETTDEIPWG